MVGLQSLKKVSALIVHRVDNVSLTLASENTPLPLSTALTAIGALSALD
jgi:hypothetical protein